MKDNFYAFTYLLLALFFMPLALMGIFVKTIGGLLLLPMIMIIGDFNKMNNEKKKQKLAGLRKLNRTINKKNGRTKNTKKV